MSPLTLDITLAYAHFLTLFAAFALLLAELLIFNLQLPASKWRLLSRIDLAYFLFAIGILLTGLGRVVWGLKGFAYYRHDDFFYALVGTYALIALGSIVPTLSFMRWSKAAAADPGFSPAPRESRHVRGHLLSELILFAIAPVFAVLMARGLGI